MRTYGKDYKAHPKTQQRVSYAEYKNREATEWDVRLDLVNGFTSAKCVEHAVAHGAKIQYCFIGGEEIPDVVPSPTNKALSEEIHVHVAIILLKPAKRDEVLQILRGPRTIGKGNEYCVPRNPKFTYAGWIAHHSKLEFKLCPDNLKLYEYGDLPMDSYDEDTCWKVIKILKKFGNPDMKERFKSYGEKIDALKRMRKELEAGLDEADTQEEEKEPAIAPGWFIPEMEAKLGGKIIKIE
nr:MAG: replication associated protein [Cressdnaviricota sp.]